MYLTSTALLYIGDLPLRNLIISSVSNLLFTSVSLSVLATDDLLRHDLTGQVWATLRMAEVLLIRDLRRLDLEAVPMMLRLAVIR